MSIKDIYAAKQQLLQKDINDLTKVINENPEMDATAYNDDILGRMVIINSSNNDNINTYVSDWSGLIKAELFYNLFKLSSQSCMIKV